MVPSDPMNVPKMIPNVIRFLVDTLSVTRKHTNVHIRVQMNDPTVSEHHPDIVAAKTCGGAEPERIHVSELIPPQVLHLDASDRKGYPGQNHIQ